MRDTILFALCLLHNFDIVFQEAKFWKVLHTLFGEDNFSHAISNALLSEWKALGEYEHIYATEK